MRPMLVNALPIEFRGKDLLSINRTLGNDFAVRPANKALAPEFNPIAAGRRFVADAIGGCDVTAVRHRVTALDQLPRRMLRFTEFFFFFRMPADRRWVEKDFRAAQRRQACRLRIPLVPANQHSEVSPLGLP